MLQVQDAMYPVNTPLTPNMFMVQAISHMLEAGYTGLPVVDNKRRVIGFLSEHDCLPYLIKDSYHSDTHILVSDLMSKTVLTLRPSMGLVDLAQQMELNTPKVYAVARDGKLVGIITRSMVMEELNTSLYNPRVVA